MALIDVTKESLAEVIEIHFKDKSVFASASDLADFLLNYYTSVVPVSPLLPKPSAFAVKDIISGELIWNFTFCLTEKECRILRLKYFPTAQYKVVKLYEVVE
jgi:hypothetical protein